MLNIIKEKYEIENIKKIVNSSINYKECLEKIGGTNLGSSYNTIKKYIRKYNLDTSQYGVRSLIGKAQDCGS